VGAGVGFDVVGGCEGLAVGEGEGFAIGVMVTGLGVGTSAFAGQNVDRAGTRLLKVTQPKSSPSSIVTALFPQSKE